VARTLDKVGSRQKLLKELKQEELDFFNCNDPYQSAMSFAFSKNNQFLNEDGLNSGNFNESS
jgi:hypothetical protein